MLALHHEQHLSYFIRCYMKISLKAASVSVQEEKSREGARANGRVEDMALLIQAAQQAGCGEVE